MENILGNIMEMRITSNKTFALLAVFLLVLSSFGFFIGVAGADAEDSDFDGLSDSYEESIGTDPNNPDTDADGIHDGDDPTPKGGMFNTEEIWDTWNIVGRVDRPVVEQGQIFQVSFDVSRLLPDGCEVAPGTLDAVLYVYRGGSYNTMQRVSRNTVTFHNGTYIFEYTSADPGKFCFVFGINESQVTLGTHITSYELSRLHGEKKLGYVSGAFYPSYYTTVTTHYPVLLPGHQAHYTIKRYAYSPINDTYDFLSRFVNYYSPSVCLDQMYVQTEGNVYVHLFKTSLLSKVVLYVPSAGLLHKVAFGSQGTYNMAVTAYNEDIAWDYSYSMKFPFSSAVTTIIDPVVTWTSTGPSNPSIYDTLYIHAHKYTVTTTMNESDFHQWYNMGGLRGIVEEHPAHANPHVGDIWVSLFYHVYDSQSYGRKAHTFFDRQLSLDGDASTSYELNDLPGNYLVAVNYHPAQPYHPQGAFHLYKRYGYQISSHYESLLYFDCNSDVNLNVFKDGNVYFSNTGVNVSVSGTVSGSTMEGWDVAWYSDEQYHSTFTFTGGSKSLNVGLMAKGRHSVRAVTIFSPNTRAIVEALGLKNFPYNWLGVVEYQVRDLLLYVTVPGYLVRGHEANFSCVVYGTGMVPVQGANVDVVLSGGWSVPAINAVNNVLTGNDGSVRAGFIPPNDSRYYLATITATKGGLTESTEVYVYIRSESFNGYIHTNKPVYLPGDTVNVQFTLYDVDNARPLEGEVEVRFSYLGNGKDIIHENVVLDDFGSGDVELATSSGSPWGTYRISIYFDETCIVSRNIEVKHYDTPDTRIVFDEEMVVETGDVEFPVKVEYMFGAPVHQGVVNYVVEGYENTYEYPAWYGGFYGDGCMGMPSYSGYRWYDPAPIMNYALNVSVERGWANLSLHIPERVKRLEITTRFSDDFDHACEKSVSYFVGESPAPGLKTGIKVTPTKEHFTATDDPTFDIHVYKYTEKVDENSGAIIEGLEGGVSTILLVNVSSYDAMNNVQYEGVFELFTDFQGFAMMNVNAWGVDILNLSVAGRYFYRLSISVVGENTPPATMDVEFLVHSVVYEIYTSPSVFAPDSSATILLEALTHVPNVSPVYNYSLTVFRKETYRGYYGSYRELSPVFAHSGSANGLVNITWQLPKYIEGGRYIVRVTFENHHYEVTMEHPVEVVSDPPLEILISSTKNTYMPGDVIDVQAVISDMFDGFLYMSVNTGVDTLLQSRQLNGKNALFSFNTRDWHHDLSVNVFLIDSMSRVVSSGLHIEYGLEGLDISLEMNQTGYEPGDLASILVKVSNADGSPAVGAQVSISIADASIFEIFSDYSAANYYACQVRPWQYDWNYRIYLSWDSDVWYPEQLSSLTVGYWPATAPYAFDEWENDGVNDGDAMGGQGSGSGGGYDEEAPGSAELGDDLQSELDSTDVREWFTDLALWDPAVITNAHGEAHLTFVLPDNICGWRVRATTRTGGLLGGEKLVQFNVSKDFFLEVKLPYTVTQDDEFEFNVQVYNFHDVIITSKLGISAGSWLKVFGPVEVNVTIPANSIGVHTYRVKVFGSMQNNMTLVCSDFRGNIDALKKEMFVKPNGALYTRHITGEADVSANETVDFRDELINGTQKVILRLAPGYRGLLKMGYSMLSGYPYDCTEQITSRMIPAVLYRNYLRDIGELNWWWDRHLKKMVYRELQDLLAKQHQDGGWGWWAGDVSCQWISGWVLLGLTTARDEGFFVNPVAVQSLQNYLLNELGPDGVWSPGPKDNMDQRALTAFLYYSLLHSGQAVPASLDNALSGFMQQGNMTAHEMAFYGLGMLEKGQPIGTIKNALLSTQKGSHFESSQARGGHMEVTAWVLLLLANENVEKTVMRELLEWLNSRRLVSGDWGTTTATVATMFAILELLGNAQPINMDVTVAVNGVEIAREHVDGQNMVDFHNKLDAFDITSYLRTNGPNTVTVGKQGSGELFYELTTVEYLRKDVMVNFNTNIVATAGLPVRVEITADPVNSGLLKVIDLDVKVNNDDELVYTGSNITRPIDTDSPTIFVFEYIANGTGTACISPIFVTYKLSANQRESGIITGYYGPIFVNISAGGVRGGSGNSRGADANMQVVVKKSIDKHIVRTGEEILVKLEVMCNNAGGLRAPMQLCDYLPDIFSSQIEHLDATGHVLFPVDPGLEYQVFEYAVTSSVEYRGDMGACVVYGNEGGLLAHSGAPDIVVSSAGEMLHRRYSSCDGMANQPMSVDITLWSDEGMSNVAVEDCLAPGFEVDEGSLQSVVEDNDEVSSYKVLEDKVIFFLSSLTRSHLSYRLVPTMPGRLVVGGAVAFPMYSPDDTIESGSQQITVAIDKGSWDIKYVDEDQVSEGEEDEEYPEKEGKEGEAGGIQDIVVNISGPDGVGDGAGDGLPYPADTDTDDIGTPYLEGTDDGDDKGAGRLLEGETTDELLMGIFIISLLALLVTLIMFCKVKGKKKP